MTQLYLCLSFLLLTAWGLLALPLMSTGSSVLTKKFLALVISLTLFSTSLYYFSGNARPLSFWLAKGKQHYQLLQQLQQLGGLDTVIARIQEKLKSDPTDAKG